MQTRSCLTAAPCSRLGLLKPGHRSSAQPLPRPAARAVQQKRVRHIAAAASDASSNGSSNPLDFHELTEIIRMVNSTDVVELELKSKRFSLSMKKKEAIATPELPQVQYVAAPQQAPQQFAPQVDFQQQQAPQAPQPQQAPQQAEAAAPAAAPAADGTELLSPMGGTFYQAAAPGEAPFVKVGDKVTKGQTVGIIEAMKLMNEIEAEVSGTVVKMNVENGTPVTPGTPLLTVKSD